MRVSKARLCVVSLCASAALAPASASETITYTYDAQGRLTKVERTGSVNNGVTTQYSHDKADNRTNVTVTGSSNPPP